MTLTLNLGSGGSDLATDVISSEHHQRVKLTLGAATVDDGDVALGNPLPVFDGLAIARNVDANYSTMHKFGRNSDVDLAAAEDVWEAPTTTWVPPTAARTHDIASTDANDDGSPAGTGAQTVTIEGLDAAGAEQSETVTMNGTTNVATANTYTMIHRMYVATAGSGGENAGTITATAQTDATITAQINAGANQTTMAIYKVPASMTAYLMSWYAGTLGSTNADVNFQLLQKTNTSDAVWRPVQVQGSMGTGSSRFRDDFKVPIAFPALTLLKVRATSDANNQDVFAGFDLVLVD